MRQPPGTRRALHGRGAHQHWITAGCLILLALSGMALFHPSLFFLTNLFGGGSYTRAIHPWFGAVLLISFALLFVRFVRYNLWNRDDTRWMSAIRRVLVNDEDHVPERRPVQCRAEARVLGHDAADPGAVRVRAS